MAARTSTGLGFAIVAMVATPCGAQHPAPPAPSRKPAPDALAPAAAANGSVTGAGAAATPAATPADRNVWTSLAAILGRDVAIVEPPPASPAPSRRAVDANAPRGETATSRDGSAAAPSREGDAAGTLARSCDLLADATTGEIPWVVLDTERALGRPRELLVPYERLAAQPVDGKEPPRFALAAAAARLQRLPEFEPAQRAGDALAAAVARSASAWRDTIAEPIAASGAAAVTEVREASAPRGNDPTRDDAGAAPALFVSARELASMRMRSGVENQAFGTVRHVLVEPRRGRIDFFVVARGGLFGLGATEYLIPFGATSLAREPATGRWRLQVDRSKAQLTGAVKYQPRTGGGWLEPANAHRAREFFGAVATPAPAAPTPSPRTK
jgi:hypothetical protein